MNSKDALAALTLGRAWSALGEYPSAIREFRRSLRIEPGQGSAWFDLGIAQLDEVEADARAMTSRYADSSYAKALFAESLVQQSRYKQAESLYRSVLSSADQPPCMGAEAGFLALHEGDAQSAAARFKSEREAHPECGLALLGEARLRIDSGDNRGALDAALAAWNRDRGFFASSASLLFAGVSPDHARSFFEYLAQRRASGEINEDAYAALTRSAQAVSGVGDETIAGGVPPTPAAARARREYLAGHDARCAGILKDDLRNADANTLRLLAACSFFTGDYNLAYDAGDALRRHSAGSSQAEALYWCIQANEELAYESLAHFQQLEPRSAQSHILLGDIDRQREHYDDAQREYAKALAISPGSAAGLLGLAEAYFGDAEMEKTIATARKALLESPNDPEINMVMGEALIARHRFAEAEICLQKALHAKPQMLPHIHALLGMAYAADGKTAAALRELKLGASSDQDGSVHYQLARLYNKIGDRAAAAAAIQRMKLLEHEQRERAVIAVQDSTASPDDGP